MHKLTALLLLSLLTTAPLSAAVLTAPPATALKVAPLDGNFVGRSVAIGTNYIVTGAVDAFGGNVYVYRLSTGAFVKRIFSPTPRGSGNFGASVCMDGDIAYIGAPGELPSVGVSSSGAVHAINVATGKRIWTAVGTQDQRLGSAIAVSGDRVVVGGADASSAGPTHSGTVVVLDRKTGSVLNTFTLPGPLAEDRFGASVAISGSMMVAGAPGRPSNGAAGAGSAFVYDLELGSLVTFLGNTDPEMNDAMGSAVAIAEGRVMVGMPGRGNGQGDVRVYFASGGIAPQAYFSIQDSYKQFGRSIATCGNLVLIGAKAGADDGKAYLFDLNDKLTGVQVAPHTDAQASNLGVAVALSENALVVADDYQSAPTGGRGSLWLARNPVQMINPEDRFAKTSQPAPGAGGALYSSFADATLLENNGGIMFRAGLKGTGVTAANNSAIFNDWSANTEMILRKGQKINGSAITSFSPGFFCPTSEAWPVIRANTGSKPVVLRDDGTNVHPELYVGRVSSNVLAGGTIAAIRAITSAPGMGTAAFVYSAKLGDSGATAANDSRVAWNDGMTGVHTDLAREGSSSPEAGRTYGTMLPRLAAAGEHVVFAAGLSGETATNMAVFRRKKGSSAVTIAQKGKAAPGTTSNFSTFLGEGVNATGTTLIRATAGSTEGLWMKPEATALVKVALKGDAAPGTATDVKFSRFTRFFIANNGEVMFSAILSGTGVSSSNDQGIWMLRGSTLTLVMRESGPAVGCGSARIASITGLDLAPQDGNYAITASLTGATDRNQAQFFGRLGATTPGQRMPILSVRKGITLDVTPAQRVTSLYMGTHNVNTSGSGSTGNVRFASDLGTLIRLQYTDRSQELMLLEPR